MTLSEIFLRAFLLRHSLLMRLGTGPKVIGSRFNTATRQILDLLARNRITVTWMDLESNPATESLLRGFGFTVDDTPVVLVAGNPILKNPSLADVAAVFGIKPSDSGGEDLYDLAVVGAGPGGLAAAVYAGSEGLSTIVVESVAVGGQAGTSSRIENYLGFPAGLSGQELAARAALQAQKFAAAIVVGSAARSLRSNNGVQTIELADGRTVAARAVVIATGARYRRLGRAVPGRLRRHGRLLRRDRGRGTDVPGRGVRRGRGQLCRPGVDLSRPQRLERAPAHPWPVAREFDVALPDRRVSARACDHAAPLNRSARAGRHHEFGGRHRRDCRRGSVDAGGVRPLLLHRGGAEQPLDAGIVKDEDGFILTGPEVQPSCLLLETSRHGVFAVGDVRHGSIKRVATAVGEGSMAVRLVHERLAAPVT